MAAVRPLPAVGSIHLDARRGEERALRVSWHPDRAEPSAGVVVLSIWRGNVCSGTVRLTVEELPGLIASLATALDEATGRSAGQASGQGSGPPGAPPYLTEVS